MTGTNIMKRPRSGQVLSVCVDVVVILAMYQLMLNFRYAGALAGWNSWNLQFALFAGLALVVHIGLNWFSGVYSILSRYMSLGQALRVGMAGIVAVGILFVVVVASPLYTGEATYLIPRSVVAGGGVATIFCMICVRFARRIYFELTRKPSQASERLLLVGAGQAADMIAREIKRMPSLNLKVVGLVDERRDLYNMTIQGFPVLGSVAEAPALVKKHDVTQIIVAIPSASAEEIVSIYRTCKPAGVPIKIVPSLAELVSGTVSLRDARDLDIKDLLGRPRVETDVGAISDYIQGQTVLVTGAGGSIGSELCRQIARFGPRRLVVVDHDESSLYDLHESLQNAGFRRYVLYPASILHQRKLEKIFALHRPRLVFHAAAYKHVPLMELSPDEAVLNNIKGTLLTADMAGRYGVERFVNISTDKAVEPVNIMGATKRAGELIVRMLSQRYPRTMYASVRFGNVLGSQGSVIPIFRSQIEAGGPVTITHPDMTRYFMLIEEAVQLVLQAAIMLDEEGARDQDELNTFILEMGNPVHIVDLAQRMIDFYWKDHEHSLGVEFSGLRPGEKLDERLLYAFEEAAQTGHPLVKRVSSKISRSTATGLQFEQHLADLIALAEDHAERREIVRAVMSCVPEYEPLERLTLEKPTVVV
ncbi:MAG: polysaccharide biosynthesis protein [Armatimonadetes bacterium]|nr:polysaccharide biosynthesis protein [Armatimonadota bacterium]